MGSFWQAGDSHSVLQYIMYSHPTWEFSNIHPRDYTKLSLRFYKKNPTNVLLSTSLQTLYWKITDAAFLSVTWNSRRDAAEICILKGLKPTSIKPEWPPETRRAKSRCGILGEGQLASSHRLGSVGSAVRVAKPFLLFKCPEWLLLLRVELFFFGGWAPMQLILLIR